MARKIQVMLEDDLSGGEADETVSFALDGVSYEIDLSSRNADKLRHALQPYVDAGRKSNRSRKSGTRSTGKATGKAGEIRAWAEANGVPVSARGRVSADVVAQYEAAHA